MDLNFKLLHITTYYSLALVVHLHFIPGKYVVLAHMYNMYMSPVSLHVKHYAFIHIHKFTHTLIFKF